MQRAEPFAGQVGGRAVRQVPAGIEAHAQKRVAGLEQGEEHRLIGLRARMRLHVGEGTVKQLLGAVDGELLGDIDIDAAAVIAPPRIALGVFVGEHAALRLQHRGGDDVLAGDQLDAVLLAMQLGADRGGQLGIGLGQRRREEAGQAGGRRLLVHAETLDSGADAAKL